MAGTARRTSGAAAGLAVLWAGLAAAGVWGCAGGSHGPAGETDFLYTHSIRRCPAHREGLIPVELRVRGSGDGRGVPWVHFSVRHLPLLVLSEGKNSAHPTFATP